VPKAGFTLPMLNPLSCRLVCARLASPPAAIVALEASICGQLLAPETKMWLDPPVSANAGKTVGKADRECLCANFVYLGQCRYRL